MPETASSSPYDGLTRRTRTLAMVEGLRRVAGLFFGYVSPAVNLPWTAGCTTASENAGEDGTVSGCILYPRVHVCTVPQHKKPPAAAWSARVVSASAGGGRSGTLRGRYRPESGNVDIPPFYEHKNRFGDGGDGCRTKTKNRPRDKREKNKKRNKIYEYIYISIKK